MLLKAQPGWRTSPGLELAEPCSTAGDPLSLPELEAVISCLKARSGCEHRGANPRARNGSFACTGVSFEQAKAPLYQAREQPAAPLEAEQNRRSPDLIATDQ